MSSPKRDLSPARQRKPSFKPTIKLEDQIVLWMGEAYRNPIVRNDGQVWWHAWEHNVNHFMNRHEIVRNEQDQWPFPVLLAFFVRYHNRGGKYLAILLECLYTDGAKMSYAKVHEAMWPIIKAEGLEHLMFWSELTQSLNTRTPYLFWEPGTNMICLRFPDPTAITVNSDHYRHFVPEGVDPSAEHFLVCTNPAYDLQSGKGPYAHDVVTANYIMDRMEHLISVHLCNLLSVGGFFQFPHIGNNAFYLKIKQQLSAHRSFRHDLIWDDEHQSVKVNMRPYDEPSL